MHQMPRQGPRPSSPATTPTTNPMRSNNQRDPQRPSRHARAGSEAQFQYSPTPTMSEGEGRGDGGPTSESIKKLDQIIQNVFAKAGVIILKERMRVTPAIMESTGERKVSKWFQMVTDDIEDFSEEFRIWKRCGGFENRPKPMVIETYLDASRLKSGESLVIVDENGKRWDVLEALNSSAMTTSNNSSSSGRPIHHSYNHHNHHSQIILERWKVELEGSAPNNPANMEDFGSHLPTMYKKAFPLFRALQTTTGILPIRKLARNSRTKTPHPALQVRCRVYAGETRQTRGGGVDALRTPLFHSGRAEAMVTDFVFGNLPTPVGDFDMTVSHRNHCQFQVVETESLLSSRIGLAITDDLFKPSVPRHEVHGGDTAVSMSVLAAEVGSLPYHRQTRDRERERERERTENQQQQRYGSLSTFHGEGLVGTSPISALRAVKPAGSDTTSPPDSRPSSVGVGVAVDMMPPNNSLPVTSNFPSRPSLRGAAVGEIHSRRPSISFQPFKRGSLSGSPVPRMNEGAYIPPPSPHSVGRSSDAAGPTMTHGRSRSSLIAGNPASLRNIPSAQPPPSHHQIPPPSAPASDIPVRPPNSNRYSSSFTHRRNRASYGGGRAPDDDQISSGKQSLSSSAVQPGSGMLNEAGGGASSGSFQTDDDNIQEFLKALESKKTLQSLDSPRKGEPGRQTAQLSKFRHMRESNNALTESLNTSMQLQRSPSASSRQLTNVPGMSTSFSPSGKPLSPHSPHTPAVPSRLSENSSADYTTTTERPITYRVPDSTMISQTVPARQPGPATMTQDGTTAIDIPLPVSPRQQYAHVHAHAHAHARRSSSFAQQNRVIVDEDPEDSAQRSLSVGAEDGEPPSMSALLGLQETLAGGGSASAGESPATSTSAGRGTRPSRFLGRGRSVLTPQSGGSSLTGLGLSSRYGRCPGRGTVAEEHEEEPLLFDMSELGRERRSLEGQGSLGSDRGGRRW